MKKAIISIIIGILLSFVSCDDSGNPIGSYVAVTGINLNKSVTAIEVAGTEQLTAVITPENATLQSVEWLSSNDSVAIVSSSGIVHGLSAGEVTVTAKTVDGEFIAICTVTVSEQSIGVSEITLNKRATTLEIYQSEQLAAFITPHDATNQKITWVSSDETIATVSESGLVTAVSDGNVSITATSDDNNRSDTCEITVLAQSIAVSGVDLNKTSLQLEVAASEEILASIYPSNATNQNIIWSSNDNSIALVSSGGVVYGRSKGTTLITAKTVDGNFAATCEVTVINNAIAVSGISLNKASTTVKVGKTEQLSATITPEGATNKQILWSSSDESIVIVSSDGAIYGVSGGIAVITAKTVDGDFTTTCEVTVSDVIVAVTDLTLNKTETNINVGKTEQLTGTILPEDADNKGINWKSFDESIVIVSASGVITGISAGSTIVVGSTVDGGFVDSIDVTVEGTVAVLGLSLDTTEVTLDVGFAFKITPQITPSNATNQKVIWSTDDATIANVSSNGNVVAISTGTTTITATTEDGGYTATCEVTVALQPVSVTTDPIAGVTESSYGIRGTEVSVRLRHNKKGILHCGVCWNTSGNPTIADSYQEDIYSHNNNCLDIDGLTENMVYYMRAYCYEDGSPVYGNTVMVNSGYEFGKDHAGGYVFYNDGTGGGLVVSKQDLLPSVGEMHGPWIKGGDTQTTFNGNTLSEIGSGYANSLAIVNQSGHTSSVAQLCLDYVDGEGYDDWFLPSKDELNAIYYNLKNNGFIKSILELYHFSSTENLSNDVWIQSFSNGREFLILKSSDEYYLGLDKFFGLRAVRNF